MRWKDRFCLVRKFPAGWPIRNRLAYKEHDLDTVGSGEANQQTKAGLKSPCINSWSNHL